MNKICREHLIINSIYFGADEVLLSGWAFSESLLDITSATSSLTQDNGIWSESADRLSGSKTGNSVSEYDFIRNESLYEGGRRIGIE